jgi:hypothetical protein
MAESLKEVIAKLKAKQQNSSQQLNKVVESPVKAVIPAEIEAEDDDFDDLDEEKPKTQEKPVVVPQQEISEAEKEQMSREQQILMEIEMLQNNGRYRAELLHQLQEINKALVVIAGVLVDLSNNGK